MTYCCAILPMPPSTNNLFAGKARRYPTNRYQAWRTEAGIALVQQKPLPRYTEPVAVTLSIGRPDKRKRDLDNLAKPVLDLLTAHGVLADDRLVEDLRLLWSCEIVGVRVEIEHLAAARAA